VVISEAGCGGRREGRQEGTRDVWGFRARFSGRKGRRVSLWYCQKWDCGLLIRFAAMAKEVGWVRREWTRRGIALSWM